VSLCLCGCIKANAGIGCAQILLRYRVCISEEGLNCLFKRRPSWPNKCGKMT
jgi:hypothetical protein